MLDWLNKNGGFLLVFLIVGIPVIVSMLPLIVLLLCIFAVVVIAMFISDKLKLNL